MADMVRVSNNLESRDGNDTRQPENLTPGEELVWQRLTLGTRKLFSQVDRELVSAVGYSLFHHLILKHLSEAPERSMRMNELSEVTSAIPSSISHAISRLEQDGFVERVHCSQDRRGWFARLTETGEDRLAQSEGVLSASLRKHFLELYSSEEVASLSELLARLAVKKIQPSCPNSMD